MHRIVSIKDAWNLDTEICVSCQFSRSCSLRSRRVRFPEKFLGCSMVKKYLQQQGITIDRSLSKCPYGGA